MCASRSVADLPCYGSSEAVPVNEMVTEEDTFQADFNQSFAMKVFKPLFDPESFLYIDLFSRRRYGCRVPVATSRDLTRMRCIIRLTANKLVVQACVNMSRIEESPGVSHQVLPCSLADVVLLAVLTWGLVADHGTTADAGEDWGNTACGAIVQPEVTPAPDVAAVVRTVS